MGNNMSNSYKQYVQTLEKNLNKLYTISNIARSKGLDPSLKTECIIAKDIADLVEGLIGPEGVAKSIRKLNERFQREEIAFKIAKEIIQGNFGKMEPEALAEQAIRTALAIFTEGLTAAPIQGISQVKIKTNLDQSEYLAIYFAGPIRSAGGTDQALTLVVGDFVRRLLGLDKYKPTSDEINRFTEELRLYERAVGRFQYHIPDEELKKALNLLPVEVTGTESDKVEVSSYRNLPRIETNHVRGGALRVVNDGIVGRALKVLTIIEQLGFQGWDWLKTFRIKSEKKTAGFMDDVIAGRPIFSFPSRLGGFRLRYGRSRNTGLAAVGIHPATMLVLDNFLAGGTQLRLQLPGKGGVTMPVDYIEPPIVLLKDGSVVRVFVEDYFKIKHKIKKILFLGDILISFGDFLYTRKQLSPSGYVEEWWIKDLNLALAKKHDGNIEDASLKIKIDSKRLTEILNYPFKHKPTVEEAEILSITYKIPLHPAFIFYWSNISSINDVLLLREWLSKAKVSFRITKDSCIEGPLDNKITKILQKLFVPFTLFQDTILLEGETAYAFCLNLGYTSSQQKDCNTSTSVLNYVSLLSGIKIMDKAPTYVGARMGRPEKAKRREMRPLVHVLFPVGLSGGSRRDLIKAATQGPVFINIVKRKCPICKTYTLKVKCGACGTKTIYETSCPRCGTSLKSPTCPTCKVRGVYYQRQAVNFKILLKTACQMIKSQTPKLLKGVKGLTNGDKTPESIEKGVLRAKYDLSVYKDGTIRFDATNAPLTHFKPSEIGIDINQLQNLGYSYDINGESLTSSSQIFELKIQDVVIPRTAAKYFIQVANFIDDLLTKFYDLPPFYNVKKSEDLIGHSIMGLAPHTCVSILGRIIGFTDLNVCYAHPIWHSAKRRDCDGDEDAILLALDTLLNFSRLYLPAQIGGIMDAPLLLTPFINTKEVQRQAHDLDVDNTYSLEFFKKTFDHLDAKDVSPIVDIVSHRLGTEAQFQGFSYTMPVSNINLGNATSSYKQFSSMIEKLHKQLDLGDRIDAVDVKYVALKVLTTHFIRDIAGNLRAFSTQGFRCKSCNKRFRRLPLRGKCSSCNGLLTLTVYRGGIEKYLDAAQQLIDNYDLPDYYSQRITLIREEITALFDNNKPKQLSLLKFT
jgi:DNA polymerase II large subunit